MSADKDFGTRKRGLGRGLGALIPTAPEERSTSESRPLDVFFPSVEGRELSESKEVPKRGGSARELLQPDPRRRSTKNVSRETTAVRARAESQIVSRETFEPEPSLLAVPGASFAVLPVERIVPNPKQPRSIFERSDLEELSDSIKQVGLLQPIVVRHVSPTPGDRTQGERTYELIMGERRLRAAELAGLKEIPAIVRDTEDADLLRDALLENLHRVDLNPLEEAAAYAQLLEDFSCTQEELSQKIARSRPQIANTLRLLKLPASVQSWVAAGVLSSGHARALLGLETSKEMEELADRVITEGLSVRNTEDLIRRRRGAGATKRHQSRSARWPSPQAMQVADGLMNKLETHVEITEAKGRGRIVIHFADDADLARIADLL